mgnify:FL=1
MKIAIKQSTIHLLIALIAILSISTIYLSIEKFNESRLGKLNRDIDCTSPKKICAYIKYKYTDALEAEITLVPGEYYYLDEKKKEYNKYWSNWLKEKSNKDNVIYDDKSFIIENFVSAINDLDNYLTLQLVDKDGFVVEKFKIDFSGEKSSINSEINRLNNVNSEGIRYAKEFIFKKKITLDNYNRIEDVNLVWSFSVENFLK